MHFAFGSLLLVVKAYRLLLCLQDIFIPCVSQSFLSFKLFYLTQKLAWKMFKKAHRHELNIWLGSLLYKQIPTFLLLIESESP